MKIKRCPKCGCERFIVTAHVTQDWEVDEYGNWIMTTNDCVEVTHTPDDDDIWECAQCGYDGVGKVFNVGDKQ